jgi:hypothetical protein
MTQGAVGELMALLNGYNYANGNPVNDVVGELAPLTPNLSPLKRGGGRELGVRHQHRLAHWS